MKGLRDGVNIVKKYMFSLFFVAVVFVMFGLVVFSCIYDVIHPKENAKEDFEKIYKIDLSYADYRQQVAESLGKDISLEEDASGKRELFSNRAVKTILSVEEAIEARSNTDSICLKPFFVEAKKTVEKTLGMDMVSSLTAGNNDRTSATDVVVRTEAGQLGYIQDDSDLSEPLENLVSFGLKMTSQGRKFLLFYTPEKYGICDGFEDYSEEKDKEVIEYIEGYGLDLYDVGRKLDELGLSDTDIFYNTDHHWKPTSGILANKLLCEYLNEKYGYDLDTSFFDPEQYEEELYESYFLGSLGKKVSAVYTEPDDFIIYYPKYDSDLTVYNSYDDSVKNGTISEVLFRYSVLEEEDPYEAIPYALYAYGDQALVSVHNNKKSDNSSILIIKTSFADCMTPYLSSVFEDMYIVDLRKYKGSLESLIEKYNPENILVVDGLATFERTRYEKGPFDFR